MAPSARDTTCKDSRRRPAPRISSPTPESPSSTLQRHLAWNEERTDERPRFYVLDEPSLASTKQMHAFLHRLDAHDRVLLVGDARQHQAIDAGRPYEQLQDAGVSVAHLTDIVRQRDPALKDVVRQLSDGDVGRAMHALDKQGRIHEIADPQERYRDIAREVAKNPDSTWSCRPTITRGWSSIR